MCGVVATLGLSRPLDAAVATLSHRGPDGGGTWRSRDHLLALGHRRLAVVGGPDAHQPVVHRGVAAVLNGQLYGWRAHPRVAPGDAGILAPLYERLGSDLGAELDGEFSLVIADEAHRRLVALRDPWGIKPLYVARIDGGLAIASEIRALIALGVCPELDDRSLAHAFAHQYLPPERSMVRGVTRIPAGGRLVAEWGDDGLEVHVDRWTQRHWEPGEAAEAGPPAAFVAALDAAVRCRLDADRPVGALLSGGLDSAAIVDSAWRQAGPLPCFTLRFPGPAYDEGAAATAFAAARACPLHTVSVTHAQLLEELPSAVAAAEGLCINGQMVARRLLARRVRQEGVVVVLSGEGSDEIGLGYPHLVVDAGVGLTTVASKHEAQSGVMLPSGTGDGVPSVDRWLGRTPSFLAAKAAFGDHLLPLLHRSPQGLFDDLTTSLAALPIQSAHPAHQASSCWMTLCLEGYILRSISDAQDMAEGVENRPPFLDGAVWELARRIPVSHQCAQGHGKEFVRAAFAARLGAVSQRPKHPFLAPPLFAELPHAAPLRDRARGLLEGLRTVDAVDERAAIRWFDDTLGADLPAAEWARRDAALWTLLSTSALATHLESLA